MVAEIPSPTAVGPDLIGPTPVGLQPGGLPPVGPDPSRGVRATINASTVERAFSIIMAVGGIGFAATNIGSILAQLPRLDVWGNVVAAAVGVSILYVGLSGIVYRLARSAQVAVALMFLVALVTWPMTVHGVLPVGESPWPYWLCNVATQAAALGFATWRAVVYTVLVPLVYAVIRLTPQGGGVSIERAALDGVYILILGGAGLALVTVLRRAAAGVDVAQATAVSRYASAIHEHATELERVQVDAIVHDSVLTTLLSAARAETDDAERLAASMATNAIAHLARASGRLDLDAAPVRVDALRDRIADAVGDLAAPVEVTDTALDDRAVPAVVAEALASAALQAAVNSVQHAGGVEVRRTVRIVPLGTDGVEVVIRDDGAGFDMADVPAERLGVRRSILERVTVAGGDVQLVSAPGSGTRIVLQWAGAGAGAGTGADRPDGEDRA
ncbi:sensor histidine kinase [Curtobacterium sp. RRHDQ10]|uniref:sensor histidine kinase n=1 Tax=Curtobacterium phyllosphaerae TaxID=3413379 RepID=UPI003BF3AA7D